ncbi:acyl-CoA dehydrogenase family protein [Acidiferrimicrobium sp. IK]|uniref:acyl-CoA dehydrogenase family protein n=1 Tax=Acidiferrimicrobium sp. IK TaxID=2871700 RepID=UPI0021CB2A68|nr:acyl-CoA dehydrogenase family protein [Acidiferrimicrobium sp. IK]MCU4183228.1 acyl-CoA dehydrogenase family protein [Acidiferrimicrobium sp. IK]
MTLAITEDHRLLAETARAVLNRQGGIAAAREATDSGSDKLPASWDELVGLGWLGLAVPEDLEGQGYGLPELAVVLYELGRSVTPGPFLPTVWAAAVLARCAPDDLKASLLPDLATGRRSAAVGLDAGAVAGGAGADIVLLVDGDDIVVAERAALSSEALDSLDRTRPLASVTLTGAPVGRLAGAAGAARDLGRTLAAAEAAGVASACLDAANAYAKEREQFGRVIGSFQAVKHHLANMLVDTELATAAAWDAARAADIPAGTDGADMQLHLAATAAAAQAFPGAVRVAKKNIQVSGGIGFTWEHDAHIYLRRVTTLRALFDGDPDPAVELTVSVRGGARRAEGVDLPPEAEEFRARAAEARQRILALPEGERRAELVSSGYLFPHWPAPWGRGAGAVEQLVIDEVFADVERPDMGIGGWVTLTIAQHGTPDQLERFVGPSLRGELMFCQMFSEPNAGSDAAAIRTKGQKVDGGWLVNGQKVWTSNAHLSNRGFATVRTDPDGPKHAGVSMMVIDLTSEGVDIRPLRQITGEAHFNEVFFTDVFVPDDDVVGKVGDGWKVARATLGNERVSIGGGPGFGTPARDYAADAPADGRFDHELGELIAEAMAQRALQQRLVARAVEGAEPGAEGNVTKLASGELTQRVSDLALRMAGPSGVIGPVGAAGAGRAYEYLNALCLTIAGGTSEIVRNQIGERLLGLPREPLLK